MFGDGNLSLQTLELTSLVQFSPLAFINPEFANLQPR